MKLMSKAKITALGVYTPEKKMTNADFEKIVDTTDEWIVSRTGIEVRNIAADNEFASDLAIAAIQNMVKAKNVNIEDVDMLIITTITNDLLTPSTAAIVQGRLGLLKAGVIDVNAACAGFVYGLFLANSLITVGQNQKVLVVATEVMSKITDYEDRTTCILFGDAAGAALVERDDDNPSFLANHFGANGELGSNLYCTGLAESLNGIPLERKGKIFQDGRGVYNYVIKNVPQSVQILLNKCELEKEQINWFVPHSANVRMIQSISQKIGFSMDQTLMSVVENGNTSSASIPLALWKGLEEKKIKKGDLLLLYGFGGGLNHAGTIIRWQY